MVELAHAPGQLLLLFFELAIIYKLLTLAIVAWVVMVMRKRWVPRWFWPILRLELVGLTAVAMFVVASNLTLLGWL